MRRTGRARRLAGRCAGIVATAAMAMSGLTLAHAADTVPDGEILHAEAPTAVAGQYIVALEAATIQGQDGITAVAGALADTYGGQVRHTYAHALVGFSVRMTAEQARDLATDPRVRYIEQDSTVHVVGTQSPTPAWGIDRIDQRDLPLDDSYTYPNTGEGVTLYSIDTGVRITHEEFGDRARYGYDAIDEDDTAGDCAGHGTHTSGIMVGADYGVAKGSEVVAVRVLGCGGSGSWADVIEGIDWVTEHAKGPSVANMSLGGAKNRAVNEAVRNSIQSGVTYTVAAGNKYSDAYGTSPSSVEAAVVVGATDRDDSKAGYSNYGECLDLFAPGTGIWSAWYTSDTATEYLSGTSMAAPHAAGAAALYLASHPGAAPAEVEDALVTDATRGVVTDRGPGSPNLLLHVVTGQSPPGPGGPVAEFAAECSASEPVCSFDGSGSSDPDGSIASYAWEFGDGATATGASVEHTYAEAGSYSVTLTVTDEAGHTGSVTKQVSAGTPSSGEKPSAGFSVNCQYTGGCTFDGSASSDDRSITGYRWDFGDGATGSGQSAQHEYSTEGWVTATLTVTDEAGQTDTAQQRMYCVDFGQEFLCYPQ